MVGLAIASGLALLPAAHALIELPDPARFALTLVYVVAIGIPLGMPFVAGVRLLGHPHQVAWAWAVNGASAVVGSCLLMILMVFSGSGASFAVAAAAYALALGIRTRLARARSTA